MGKSFYKPCDTMIGATICRFIFGVILNLPHQPHMPGAVVSRLSLGRSQPQPAPKAAVFPAPFDATENTAWLLPQPSWEIENLSRSMVKNLLGCPRKLGPMVSKWVITYFYMGVYWGYNNPLILTFDPNFQRDIQVGDVRTEIPPRWMMVELWCIGSQVE